MKLIIMIMLITCFTRCTIKQPQEVKHRQSYTKAKKDTLTFKRWLSDTLQNLKAKNSKGYSIVIAKDSSYFDLTKKYDTLIDPKIKYDDEIGSALNLLDYHDTIPKEKFNLLFEITYYYELGYSTQYSYEINKFIVKNSLNEVQYSFMKGNLIDKRVIK